MLSLKAGMYPRSLAKLVSYLRQQFAPEKPPWTEVHAAVSRARQAISR